MGLVSSYCCYGGGKISPWVSPPKKNICIPGQYESSYCSNPPSKASNVFPTSGLPIWLKLTGVFIQGDSPIKKHMGQFEPYYFSHSHRGKPPKPSNGSWVADTTQHGTGIQEFSHCNEKIFGDKLRGVFFVRKSSSQGKSISRPIVILVLKKQQYPVVCLCNNFLLYGGVSCVRISSSYRCRFWVTTKTHRFGMVLSALI